MRNATTLRNHWKAEQVKIKFKNKTKQNREPEVKPFKN